MSKPLLSLRSVGISDAQLCAFWKELETWPVCRLGYPDCPICKAKHDAYYAARCHPDSKLK